MRIRKFDKKEEKQYFQIKDHVLAGITETGEFLLLPKPKENVGVKIGIYGETQSGKSISLNALCDRIHYNWGARCFLANDNQSRSHHHQFPECSPEFLKKLKYINQEPKGLPLVMCYPMTKTLRVPSHVPKLKLSIPLSEFIARPENFIGKKLGASAKYFSDLKEDFLNASNFEDIKKILAESIKKGTIPKGSATKIRSTLNELVNEKIFDIDNNEGVGSVKIFMEEHDDYAEVDPIVALLMKNLIPVLVTENIWSYSKDFMASVFEYYMRQILESKQEGQPLCNIPVYAFVDEFNTLVTKETDTIIRWVTEGGNMQVGLVWCGQNYADPRIHFKIKENTPYGMAFTQKSKSADAIAADFSLTNSEKNKLKKLKTYEFMALTTQKWILLDPSRPDKLIEVRDPVIAKTLPSFSRHRPEVWNSDYVAPTLKLKYKTNINIKDDIFKSPYELNLNPKPCQFPSFSVGQNLIQQYWSDSTLSITNIELSQLNRKGMGVLQILMPEETRFYPGQSYGYFIFYSEDGIPARINGREIDELPQDLIIQHDTKRKRVRLYGRTTGSHGIGPWFYY